MISPELHSNLFVIWMVLSVIAFIVIMVWALWPSHRRRFESYGHIPLRDDDKADARHEARS
jgi:cytochrome c oxidase cbb3-type subunit IV